MILKNFTLIKNNLLTGLIAVALLTGSCNKSEKAEVVLPAAETYPVVAYLTSTSVQTGVYITSIGSSATLTATGVVYSSTNQTPTINDSKTSDGTAYVYKSSITGLTPGTTYYARSYIQNEAGVGYGSVIKFTTSATTADTTVAVTTLAGSSTGGFANGTGAAASFNNPQGTAVDASGNVYVSDSFNHVIRKITPAGVVTTYAGAAGILGFTGGTTSTARFYSPQGIAFDQAGNLYVADQGNNAIYKITTTGTVTILAGNGLPGYAEGTGSAARFYAPQGIAADAQGNVYVADRNNNRIRKVTQAGVVTTFAGTGTVGAYVGDASTVAQFNRPVAVAVDATGNNVYVADQGNYAIRKVTAGNVSTLIGNSFFKGLLNIPAGIAVDVANNLYVTDQSGRILKISNQNVLYTLAGKTETPGFLDGSKATALFSSPIGVAVSGTNTLYVADYNNNRIRKLVIQ
jgi:DNA-binding beta-propeller fold protein YncE